MLKGLSTLLAVVVAWSTASAASLPPELGATEAATAASVIDGATFTLTDGRTVRLAALDIPRPPAIATSRRSNAAGRRELIAIQARDALSAMLAGHAVALAVLAPPLDRYGRTLAHVADAEGRWVQAEMVKSGFARVAIFADTRVGLRTLLILETEARTARRGIWALPEFRIVSADDAGRFIDTFQIIEGRVRNVERKAGRTFLNFDENWRSDFTVEIGAKLRRQLLSTGLDPTDYQGKIVRVRGWIKSRNGPLIELIQPEQIEIVAQ